MINRLMIDQNTGMGQGNFRSMALNLDFMMEPNPDFKVTEADRSPSHFVYLKSPHGPVDAGAAWIKTAQEGKNRGQKFFSISIDDPSFDQALSFYAFQEGQPKSKDEPAEYEVKWRRARSREAA